MQALPRALPRPCPSSRSAALCARALCTSSSIIAIDKVRLKWVKNRALDHIIERDTSIKAASLLKDLILRTPSHYLPSRSLPPLQKPLGLTVPPLRFLRRYPSLFHESPDPRFPSHPSFRLSPTALLLHRLETLHSSSSTSSSRLARLLMMSRSRSLPLKTLIPLRYDLGLPDDFLTSIIPRSPDLFRLSHNPPSLHLVRWPADLAVSAAQRLHATPNPPFLSFPMSFPRGYGAMKKVKAWMEEFDRLPYFSPYENFSGIVPASDVMEKRTVGVLHELLSLTIHKKTKRNYLRGLREELGLPHKFTRVFTRYPGIFYLSLKCKTTTVVLREGYEKGRLLDPHPLARVRDKYGFVMRTGVLWREKAEEKFGNSPEGVGEIGEERLLELLRQVEKDGGEEDAELDDDDEYCEGIASGDEDWSDSDEE